MMNDKRFLGLLLSLMVTFMITILARPIGAVEVPGQETPLNPNGLVHEVYRDSRGNIWISDYFAGEIWQVDPESNTYVIYQGLDGASSGIVDESNTLYYSDFDGGGIGRLALGQSLATVWPLLEDSTPLGLAISTDGDLWAVDAYIPQLYRIDPIANQLCRYLLPDNGTADYLLYNNSELWIGDTSQGRILRLNTDTNLLTIWTLEANAYPQGLALDSTGSLWLADPQLGQLSRLSPTTSLLTTYTVPGSQSEPQMIAYDRGKIWFTDHDGRVGYLEQQAAQGSTSLSTMASTAVQPECGPLGQGKTVPVAITSGDLNWQQLAYEVVQDSDGWKIFDMPAGSRPWGLVVDQGHIWFADQGSGLQRPQSLGYFSHEVDVIDSFESYVPIISRP